MASCVSDVVVCCTAISRLLLHTSEHSLITFFNTACFSCREKWNAVFKKYLVLTSKCTARQSKCIISACSCHSYSNLFKYHLRLTSFSCCQCPIHNPMLCRQGFFFFFFVKKSRNIADIYL